MPLEPESHRFLTAAEGYVELGMFSEANDELELIDAEVRHVPEVLAVRLRIYYSLKKWELLQTVAQTLAKFDPDEPQWALSLAFATRRAESIPAAKTILEEAVGRHPGDAMIHFNLACYDCQMGDIEAAKQRLTLAFTLDKSLRQAALDDPDLEPLWAAL